MLDFHKMSYRTRAIITHSTEVRFTSFLSGGFTTMAVINPPKRKLAKRMSVHCTEMRFASFLSGGFITAIVVNPPERKLAKRTSVCCLVRIIKDL